MYRRFEKAVIPDIRMQRVVELQGSDAAAFAGLGALLDAAVVKREGRVATSFDVALLNYNRSHEAGDDFERVTDLATALEAILTGSEADTEAAGHRLQTRAAVLLWTDDDPGLAIYRDVSSCMGCDRGSCMVNASRSQICASGSTRSPPWLTMPLSAWRWPSPSTDFETGTAFVSRSALLGIGR